MFKITLVPHEGQPLVFDNVSNIEIRSWECDVTRITFDLPPTATRNWVYNEEFKVWGFSDIKIEPAADLEKMLELAREEGFTAGQNNVWESLNR